MNNSSAFRVRTEMAPLRREGDGSTKTFTFGCDNPATKLQTKQRKKVFTPRLVDSATLFASQSASPAATGDEDKTNTIMQLIHKRTSIKKFNSLIQSEPMWHFTHQQNGA